MFKRILALLTVVLFAATAFAQTSGKISGVVTDKTTGETLPGVNILVENSTLGASTDVDGFYVILNVPVGKHVVTAKYVGYRDVRVSDVRVYVDNTTELNFKMEESVESTDVVEVTAERILIRKAETNSRQIRTADDIKNLPVQNVQQVVGLTAGVVKNENSNTLNVRGGRGEETAVVVDGIVQNSAFDGAARTRVNKNAIEEVTVQAGGYGAEFGQAMSGLVLTTTKTGGAKYSGIIEAYSDFLSEDDPGTVNVNASLGGPVIPGNGDHTFFISFDYFDTDDVRPSYIGRSLDNKQTAYNFVGNLKSNITDMISLRLGGTIDYIEGEGYSHSRAFFDPSPYGNRAESLNISGNLQMTVTLSPSTYVKVKAGGLLYKREQFDKKFGKDIYEYGKIGYRTYNGDPNANVEEARQWGALSATGFGTGVLEAGTLFGTQVSGNPYFLSGNFFTPVNAVSDFIENYFENNISFGVDFFTKIDKLSIKGGAGYKTGEIHRYQLFPRDLYNTDGSWGGSSISKRYNNTSSLNFGFDLFGNWVDDDDADYLNGSTNVREPNKFGAEAPRKPESGYAYGEGVLELSDFILTFGLRMDYFNSNWINFKSLTAPSGISGTNAIDPFDESDYEDAEAFTEWQPRFGFSFPVDDRTKFSANFSKLSQMPNYNVIYTSLREFVRDFESQGNTIRNPNLKPTSTTSYEIAIQHSVTEDIAVSLSTYYREIKDLVLLRRVTADPASNLDHFFTYDNQDYSDTKGFELTVETRRFNNVQIFANYTFASALGTGSSATTNGRVATADNRDEIKFQAPLDFDVPHQLNINVDYRYGNDEGPTLFGMKALENFGANMVFTFNSGRPYTPEKVFNRLQEISSRNPNTDAPIQSRRLPDQANVTLRLDKSIPLNMGSSDLDLNFYLQIDNLFNWENVLSVYRTTGLPGEDGFLESNLAADENFVNSEYKRTAYRSFLRNPNNWGLPRIIKLGMRIEF